MIKIAHFADVHWRGLTRHAEYKESFEDAFLKLKKLSPDIILIAGDIVHSKTQGISPELIDCLTWWFRCLAEIAPTHVTLGNHDGLIMNENREDAVSPIIRALNHGNIHLHKKSTNVKIGENYNLSVFSCFDEKNWAELNPVEGCVNIATYHGPVAGSLTDENWQIEGGVSTDFFEKFDFVMLGDIHKLQFLDQEKRIAYPGSSIQQNYGESQEKGFLFWAINDKKDFDSRFVKIKNVNPFVTLEYAGDIDSLISTAKSYPDTSRFRVKINDSVSQGEIIKIKSSLKSELKPTEVVFKQEASGLTEGVTLSEETSIDTLEDINKLVLDYYSNLNVSEKIKESFASYLKEAWQEAKIDDSHKSGKFHIKKMEFDNTFGYGEGNFINFDSTEGITGIFGKNRSGKSSICGTLAYGLYNGSDRGSLKNLHIINTRKNFCNVKLHFSKFGTDYLLERQTHKVVSKKGEVTAPTNLNLFQLDSHGNKKDMSEEQRRETEKILKDLVGNLEDFLITTMSSQGHVNKFIDLNAAARKSNLAKFLKLDIFDQLCDALKEETNLTKKLLDTYPDRQFEKIISDLEDKISEKSSKRSQVLNSSEDLKSQLESLRNTINSISGETFTLSEINEQEETVKSSYEKIENYLTKKKICEDKISEFKNKISEIQKESQKYDVEELKEKKKKLEETAKYLSDAEKKFDSKKYEVESDEKIIQKLNEVPCGDKFPTCKYITDAVKASNTIDAKTLVLKTLKFDFENLKKEHSLLLKESINEKLESIKNLNDKIMFSKIEMGKIENESSKIDGLVSSLRISIVNEEQKLDKMKINVCDDSEAAQRNSLLQKKKNLEFEIKNCQDEITKLSEQLGLATAELSQAKKQKDEFEIRSHKFTVLKMLGKALSKNGIPLSIVRKKLPQINRDLSNILHTVAGFTLELESDESSNDMELYINYGDSRRIIECGSGMEKMMSSIALRAVLSNISNLPKSDIFIVDEGFGALDGKNLESCSALLRSLTKYFKSIIVISHVDGIKDIVDNVIEIDTKGRDSHVHFD